MCIRDSGLIVLIALVLINYILMPSLFSTPTADIDYKSFLTLVTSGQVDTVEIGDTYLSALVRDKSGQSVIYRTGLINDSNPVSYTHLSVRSHLELVRCI